jgi:polysaccharide biosynthesis/export protein
MIIHFLFAGLTANQEIDRGRGMRIPPNSRKAAGLCFYIVRILFFWLCASAFGQTDSIRKGDILEITVYNHQDLSKSVLVQQNGTIDYPLISRIPIDGMSFEEFRNTLTTQVARYLGERPNITVRLVQTLLINVTVLGQVVQPGQFPVPKNATIQGAITSAGGFTPRAQLDKIRILRKNDGGKEKILTVNLLQFFEKSDFKQIQDIEDGDIILVPGSPGAYEVTVLGAVRMPGSYPVQLGTSLLEMLFKAGGFLDKADLRGIRLYSPTRSKTMTISLNVDDILNNSLQGRIPDVTPGDVVYVPLKGKNILEMLMAVVTVASPIILALYYTGVLKR